MGAPPLMDMPLFESGLETEGGSTSSVAIASPFESSSALPYRSEPLPPSARDLVDCLRHPLTSAGHLDRHGSADTPFTVVVPSAGKLCASSNARLRASRRESCHGHAQSLPALRLNVGNLNRVRAWIE